ncbi:FAS1-like dehydratase domain-containing protein [Rhodococcus opacus]|uniref:FAS1-like dehydratase domain-containing protein n=1 Tax=Rhodococcus opacus TaxID=37919 RepID=UPI001C445AA0|nr:MaoC family dehydratase N-terminal domain-containing protein [Rhodococcus opacus]MBV6759093.1 MaoC family dehydratase N-terminal domain-containing protein [Rhodococcus opacus]
MSTETITADVSAEYGTMSEEAVARLRSRLGKVMPIEKPYIRHINADSITHFARAVGDQNPLYLDEEYAEKGPHGDLIAPPGIFYGVAWGSWDLRRGQGLPGVHGLHSGDHWQFFQPVRNGDVLRATKELIKADFKEGRMASRMLVQADEIRFYNQRDELVAIQTMPIFRMERGESKSTGKNAELAIATYTPEEIAQIDAELDAEKPRGTETRYWEDVQIGDVIDPITKGPLTVPEMVAWLQGIGSPHVRAGKYWLDYRRQSPKVAVTDPKTGIPQAIERVHWDDFMAAEIGMPAPYDYGSQRGGYATYWASLYPGDEGWVADLDFQYRGMVFIGDVYRIKGEIVDKWRGAKTGTGYVKGKFTSVNQRGLDVMPGTVIFALPSKETGAIQFPINVEDDGRA